MATSFLTIDWKFGKNRMTYFPINVPFSKVFLNTWSVIIALSDENGVVEISEQADVGARSVFMKSKEEVILPDELGVANLIRYDDFLPRSSERHQVEYFLGKSDLYVLDRKLGKLGVFSFLRSVVVDYDVHDYPGGIREFCYGENFQIVIRNDGRVFSNHQPVEFADITDQPMFEKASIGYCSALISSGQNLYIASHNYSNRIFGSGELQEFKFYHSFPAPIRHLQQSGYCKWVFLENGHVYQTQHYYQQQFEKIDLNFGTICEFSQTGISFMNDNLDVFIVMLLPENSEMGHLLFDENLNLLKVNLEEMNVDHPFNSFSWIENNLFLYNDPIKKSIRQAKLFMQISLKKQLANLFLSDISITTI